jgi:hypothetical protein
VEEGGRERSKRGRKYCTAGTSDGTEEANEEGVQQIRVMERGGRGANTTAGTRDIKGK